MKNIIALIFILFTLCACTSDRAGILFNQHPISEKNIYDNSTSFLAGKRIYYVILMPKKVESRYLYIQIIKKDNDYGRLGYDLIMTKDIRLKDEEINYHTDYFVINSKGHYIMRVYSKDNPKNIYTTAEFAVN